MLSEHFAELMKLCLLYKFIQNIFTLVPAYFWMTEPFWVAFLNNQSAVSSYHVYLCPQCSQSELVWKVFRHQILNNQIFQHSIKVAGVMLSFSLDYQIITFYVIEVLYIVSAFLKCICRVLWSKLMLLSEIPRWDFIRIQK